MERQGATKSFSTTNRFGGDFRMTLRSTKDPEGSEKCLPESWDDTTCICFVASSYDSMINPSYIADIADV
jgi:hypothetical protein